MADYIDTFRKSKRRTSVTNDERKSLEELGWNDTQSINDESEILSEGKTFSTSKNIPIWKIAFIISGIQLILNLPCYKNVIKSTLPFFKNDTYIIIFNSLILFLALFFLLNLSSNKT